MNAKKKRASLVDELKGLVDGVKAGDADAMTRSDELVAELEEVDALLEKAAEKAETLDALGRTSAYHQKGAHEMSTKSYVEELKDALQAETDPRKSVTVEMKAATDTIVSPNPGQIDYQDRIVAYPNGRLGVRDLMPTEQVSTGSFGFFQVQTEGTPGVVAEDGAKPQMSADATLVTKAAKTIGAVAKITDEMRQDYPRLVSVIQNRLTYEYDLAEEAQIITDLLAENISTDTYAQGANAQAKADAIFSAMMTIKADTGYDADAVLINPTDFEELRLAKDANLQYFGGGMFQGPYGSGVNAIYPRIWGLIVVVTSDVAAGTFVVGAFREAAAYAVRGPRQITVGYDGVDFSHDRATVRIAGRGALEVFVPAAFVELTEAE